MLSNPQKDQEAHILRCLATCSRKRVQLPTTAKLWMSWFRIRPVSLSEEICVHFQERVRAAASIQGFGGSRPQNLGRGSWWSQGGRRGSWTGRGILLYLIMYRRYVRKR